MDEGQFEPKRNGIRWKPLAIWMGFVTLLEASIHLYHHGRDSTFQGFAFMVYYITVGISLVVWWLFVSRATLRQKGMGIMGALACLGMFRCDGYRGDLMPRVSFRWALAKETPLPTMIGAQQDGPDGVGFEGYSVLETDWPEYRGNGRRGIVQGAGFQESWIAPKELWRIAVGTGWSSFTSVGHICWTQGQLDYGEAVTALDVQSGKVIWQHIDPVRFDETFGGMGPRATPTFEKGRLWTLGATGFLNCLDAARGKVVWTVDILEDNGAPNIEWGMTASPLIHKDKVIVLPGGGSGRSLVAYDKLTGKKVWSGGDSVASYSSPQVSVLDGVEQVIVHNGIGLAGHSLEDGHVLWEIPWTTMSKVNVAQPIIHAGNQVLISSGYQVGSVNLEVTQEDGNWKVKELWRSKRLKAKFNTLIPIGKYVYGLDEGILTCLDMETGERQWKGGRYGYGQFILAGDAFLVLSERGEVVFVRATPEKFEEIGKFKALDDKTWQHPTIANGKLFVRNSREAVCYQLE